MSRCSCELDRWLTVAVEKGAGTDAVDEAAVAAAGEEDDDDVDDVGTRAVSGTACGARGRLEGRG